MFRITSLRNDATLRRRIDINPYAFNAVKAAAAAAVAVVAYI